MLTSLSYIAIIGSMDEISQISGYLSQNILHLRRKKKWSQQQLAEVANIPRSTVTHIESGEANPSLINLAKVSGALGVGIEELLSRPRSESILIPADQVPKQYRSQNQIQINKLLPDKIKGIEIDRVEFAPGATMGGHPHLIGTKEYMTVIKGEINVHLSGEAYTVKKGDVLAFPGNQPHSYRNPRQTPATMISIVLPIPANL